MTLSSTKTFDFAALGKLWLGFTALEFGLRRYLAIKNDEGLEFIAMLNGEPFSDSLAQLIEVPKSFRKQPYLGTLISKFQTEIGAEKNTSLADKRNILAHGFIKAEDGQPLKALKLKAEETPESKARRNAHEELRKEQEVRGEEPDEQLPKTWSFSSDSVTLNNQFLVETQNELDQLLSLVKQKTREELQLPKYDGYRDFL